MIKKKYFEGLLKEGLTAKTLSKLSETQLKNLYKRMVVSEQTKFKVPSDKMDDVLPDLQNNLKAGDEVEVTEQDAQPKSPSTWKKQVHSKRKSDNKKGVFVEKGNQSVYAKKHGHKGFVSKGEKLDIGGHKRRKKEFVEQEVDTLTKEKKGDTTIPKFMDMNIFKGKMKEIMGGGQEVETPVKPDVKPDVDPGKPRVKPAHRPKPKALKEDGKYPKRISLNEKALKQLMEKGKCNVNGVEINYKK